MKTKPWFFALIGLSLAACTAQKQTASLANDEVYSTPAAAARYTISEPAAVTQVVTAPDKSVSGKPASSTWQDDYNDYSYSSRIKRFNNSDTAKSYFDEQYTGDGLGSVQDNSPNVNIYLGYGTGYDWYFGPSYTFGWGYPYSRWGWGWDYYWGWPSYSYWGYPYYRWGYPYSYGYNPWYNPCGYCPPYYYDWYAGNYPVVYSNTYYGPRNSLFRSDVGSTPPNNRIAGNQNNIQPPNDRVAGSPPNNRALTPTGRENPTGAPYNRSAAQEKYRYNRSAKPDTPPNTRTIHQEPRSKPGSAERSQSSPRYIRPENAAAQRTSPAQNYSSPVYRQPKTSQEYLAPRSQPQQNQRNTFPSQNDRSSGNTYTAPSRSSEPQRRITSPGRTEPMRTNPAPSRSSSPSFDRGSFSSPQRSNPSPSYSAPSRSSGSSGGSFSAPSRSSGSGSSAPSSGGGSGRRR